MKAGTICISKWMTKEALQNHCKLTQMELDKQPVRCEVGIFSTEISQPTPLFEFIAHGHTFKRLR